MKFIDGGVCAAQGFKAAGLHVGVKTHKLEKKDVALIVSDVDCSAAAVFCRTPPAFARSQAMRLPCAPHGGAAAAL